MLCITCLLNAMFTFSPGVNRFCCLISAVEILIVFDSKCHYIFHDSVTCGLIFFVQTFYEFIVLSTEH